jgi:hypothetical protein
VASVASDFIDAAFVMVWGGVVSLSFREVFYRTGASENFVLLYCFFLIFRLCIFIFIYFFCTSIRTTATE